MTIATIATIVVIVILVLGGVYGFSRGFLRILLTTLSLVVTLMLATIFAAPFAGVLNKSFIGKNVEKTISTYVDSKIGSSIVNMTGEAEDRIIDSLPVPPSLKENIREGNTPSKYIELGVTTFRDYVSVRLKNSVVTLIAFFILTIGIYIIIRIILKLLHLITKIPIVKGINRLFGAIIGVAEVLIILWVLCLLITAISQTPFGIKVVDVINQSEFLSFLYNNNLLALVISKII